MKRISIAILLIGTIVLSFHCQKELSLETMPDQTANNLAAPITATLQGNVLDENGQPAAGVGIAVGSYSSITNAKGYFRITNAALDKKAALVTAAKPGYFKAYRTFAATSGVNQVVIQLIKKTMAGTVKAATGGDITLANGATISLPANAVVKAGGGSYAGDINVYAAYINPLSANIGQLVPGSFMADDNSNKRVLLKSFGMLAVELSSPAGEKLQLATSSPAVLTTPIPATLLQIAPDMISLWYVDETTGIWKEDGYAQKSGNNYVGRVKHFSYWNCDIGLPAIRFTASFKTTDGGVLKNLEVSIRLKDSSSNGSAHGYTDSLGQLSGLIPANKNLVMEVRDDCFNIVYTKDIGPFNQTASLGTIVLPTTLPSLITLKGKLVNCNNTGVSRGYALISFNNTISYIDVQANGEFSTSFLSCASVVPSVLITGVDSLSKQQGTPVSIPVTSPVTDAGNINACGISTEEYIRYTLDGADYAPADTLLTYSFIDSIATFQTRTFFMGRSGLTNNQIEFNITGKQQPGSYPVEYFTVNNFSRIAFTSPMKINLQTFPQNVGSFFEGNFSGSFKDSSALPMLHNINGTFRIQKRY